MSEASALAFGELEPALALGALAQHLAAEPGPLVSAVQGLSDRARLRVASDGKTMSKSRDAALRAAMLEELEPEIQLTCRIAVLLAAGHKRIRIERQLAVDALEFKHAWARLKRAAERLDQGDSYPSC